MSTMAAMLGYLAIYSSVQVSCGAFTPATKDELSAALQSWFARPWGKAGHNASRGNISDWNVSRVADMSFIFSDVQEFFFKFEPHEAYDLSKWDAPKCFLSEWDVSKVTNMSGMFRGNYDS